MQKISLFLTLLTALMVLGSCTSSGDEPVGYQQVSGDWYYELEESGLCYDIRQGDELTETAYDHIGILLTLDNGIGSWTHYYLKDGELVNYDGRYSSGFNYTIGQDARLYFISDIEDDEDRSTPLDGLRLYYDASGDAIKTENVNGVTMTLRRLSAQQQEKLTAWNAIIDDTHIGLDDSDYNTDIKPDHATEPSRTTKRHTLR